MPGSLTAHLLPPAGGVPNHPRWPLLVYQGVLGTGDMAAGIEALFTRHRWPAAWRDGVYPYHHYHSNAHEVLGIYEGEVTAQFGGEPGVVVTARAGDVIVLPAGTGHRRIASRGSLGVVGAYPEGSDPDMCRPERADTARSAATIARVPLPACDPVDGAGGRLFRHWPAQ